MAGLGIDFRPIFLADFSSRLLLLAVLAVVLDGLAVDLASGLAVPVSRLAISLRSLNDVVLCDSFLSTAYLSAELCSGSRL